MLTRNEYDILFVTLAWLGGFAPLFVWEARRALGHDVPTRPPLTWLQCLGLALVLVPFARMGINVWLSFDRLLTYTVLEPASREALWRAVGRQLQWSLLVPLGGLLLAHNALPGWHDRRAPRGTLQEILRAHGLAPRHSWSRDALHGLALFAFIAAAYLVALLLSRTALSGLSANGDESRYWANLTLPLIVLLSATAGISEEFLFRGLLFAWLSKRMHVVLAAVAQAVAFGLIHSGYGTWLHVAGPLVFGLGMAWVARTLGVWVAALLHAEINLVFFAIETLHVVEGAWILLAAFGLLNIGAAAATRLEGVRLLWQSLVAPLRRLRAA